MCEIKDRYRNVATADHRQIRHNIIGVFMFDCADMNDPSGVVVYNARKGEYVLELNIVKRENLLSTIEVLQEEFDVPDACVIVGSLDDIKRMALN